MTEEQYPKQALDKFRQWHFWWLVVFSVLLIVTFVYYLPARFLNQIQPVRSGSEGHMMDEMDEMHEEMAGDHEEDAATEDHGDLNIEMKIWPTPFVVGTSLNLDFSAPISDLEIEHEKLMHAIGVRSDLNEFFHIHPEPISDNLLSVAHTFNKSGVYKIWSEVKKGGMVHAFDHLEINVEGIGLTEEKPFDPTQGKHVSFGRNIIVGDYQVALEHDEPLAINDDSKLHFDVKTLTGGGVELGNYLGEPMHLALIKDDLKIFIHTHPEDHGHSFNLINQAKAHGMVEDEHEISEKTIEFNVNFPEPGLYKAFAQFRPAGLNLPVDESLVAEFWLEVEDKKPAVIKVENPWWMLLFVSIVLIAILSLIVKKYITVK